EPDIGSLESPMLSSSSTEPLPPYSYVPGGPWPHPLSSPRGHSFGYRRPKVEPAAAGQESRSPSFLRGVELFNAGYYWEAHEVWEGLWHAHGRRGATAEVLKALIKLAAAGVKVREGQEHGVRTHARRAGESLALARQQGGPFQLGLDLDQWIDRAHDLADNPPSDRGMPDAPVVRVFAFQIEIDDSGTKRK
ncbi:MAG TPA: DUF309 domain-containing protein, partial [Isosphaeraceae bacterium]|nr:DUF309 domain-containing protein [Isosphaeraceae bacterium]